MKTLYVIDRPAQRDLILRDGAPHDLEAPILGKVIDWPWMRPWSSPFGEGAKVWTRVQEISKPLGVAFLDAGKDVPPRLNAGVGADNRIMAQLKDRSNLREGAWTCVEVIADAREDKGPRGRLIPPIPEVAQSKGKAQVLRPATDPLAFLAAQADAIVCLSKPDSVQAVREAAPGLPIDFFKDDSVDPADAVWQVTDGIVAHDEGGLRVLLEAGLTGSMIDVNATAAPNQRLQLNKKAAAIAARSINALNLGGLIVVDFLNLETKAERATLTTEFKELLDHPICATEVEAVNHLGVGLVTRARRGFSVAEQNRALHDLPNRVPPAYAQALEALTNG